MMKKISGDGFRTDNKIDVMTDRYEDMVTEIQNKVSWELGIFAEYTIPREVRKLWKDKHSRKDEIKRCDRGHRW